MDVGAVPVLRIHFTCEDLARLTIAAAPDPLWETVLSLRALGRQPVPAWLAAWRRHTLAHLTPPALQLLALVRSSAGWPDLLTPTRGGVSLEQALGEVTKASPQRVRADLANLEAPPGGAGGWPRALQGGGPQALQRLERAVRRYFDTTLAPCWPQVQAAVEGERARLSRVLVDSGVEGVLNGLSPGTCWEPPLLCVPHALDVRLVLEGRSLVLLPSVFCLEDPLTRLDLDLPPVLVFGTGDGGDRFALRPGGPPDRQAVDRRLAALLGRTRAAVLQAVSTACTTTELARRVGTSLPSASQHAGVLRDAGLITSKRHRNAVLHSATGLGTALLTRAGQAG